MIRTKKELNDCLKLEKEWYFQFHKSIFRKLYFVFTKQHRYEVWGYVRLLRICEFLMNSNTGNNAFKTLKFAYYERKRNKLGNRLGFYLPLNVFDEGLRIEHNGSVIVNPKAKVGKNCHIHGVCCIGNTGQSADVPVLGNNVDIGWGAIIVGIKVADNVVIGANAVVSKSIDVPNSVWVGIPAHQIK